MKKGAKLFLFSIAVITAAVLVAAFVLGSRGEKSLSENIMAYYDKQEAETYAGMKLEDFTAFEWDYVVIYKFPTTAEDISKKLLMDYTTENDLSLTSGMIFVKSGGEDEEGNPIEDKQIVYEETFKTDYESPYKFVIYPEEVRNGDKKVVHINKQNAVFAGKRTTYNGENRYIFYPDKG